jgi:urease accessory protein
MALPWSETAVAVTVAAAALVVGMRVTGPIGILAVLFLASGLFHGYAYGESIVGAETAPLAAYVLGFGAIQYCIAAGSGAALRTIVGRDYLSEAMAMRIAGGGIALAAAFAFVNVALAG